MSTIKTSHPELNGPTAEPDRLAFRLTAGYGAIQPSFQHAPSPHCMWGRMAIPLPALDALDAITIATPCDIPWGEMRGDDRFRFCGQCRRQVFDLSAMTTAEAKELLGDPGNLPCVRLYRRPDGRVMTADCPVGLRTRIWRRLRRRAAWAASLFAMLFLPACKTLSQGLVDTGDGLANSDSIPARDYKADVPTPPSTSLNSSLGEPACVPQSVQK
jgi:hypothetical protein